MTSPNDPSERPEPSAPSPGPDAAFLARLAEHYGPASRDATWQARFDARLRARLAAERGGRPWFPVLAACAAVLVLAFFVAAFWPAPATQQARLRAASASPVLSEPEPGWEADILLGAAEPTLDEAEYLPEEWLAIATAFIDSP